MPHPGLKAITGAEVLPQPLAHRILDHGIALHYQYGPTETTVSATAAYLEHPDTPVSIGRPLANTRVYILDHHLAPVAPGIPGELCIAGDGLARGYHNRPQLTHQRFTHDPFHPGQRIYRTGDLARHRPDGNLEFRGRADDQIKLRGYRIELGEIEAHLRSHPDVADAAVTVTGEGSAAHLVAYVVAGQRTPPPSELQDQLRRLMPEFMLPSAFVALSEFPRQPNGKVDRRRLPAPEAGLLAGAGHAAPSSALEHELAAIWGHLLSTSDFSIDDDFFLIGGNSLLAVRLALTVEEQLGRTCTIAMVLRNNTIRRLAAELAAGGEDTSDPVVLELARGRGPALFCLVGVHLYQKLAERLAPDYSTYGIFLPVEQSLFRSGRRRQSAFSMEKLAAAYVEAIRSQQPHGPYRLLGFCFGGLVAYEAAQQLRRAGEEVLEVVMIDTGSPLLRVPWRGRLAVMRAQTTHLTFERLPVRAQRRWLGEQWAAEGSRLSRLRSRIYHGVARKYRPAHYPGPVTLFQPDDGAPSPDPTWGWGSLAPRLTVCKVSGGHTTVLDHPHVDAFSAALRRQISRPADPVQPGARLDFSSEAGQTPI